ncbi:MAG: hypothetical protein JRJ87_26840 [Deltaproteobacteria bacterium]|nr:hypothetical protein [Deltaproteobacteria bacterium]
MNESDNILLELSPEQKLRLLGALAQLSMSDRKLAQEEEDLFINFAGWLGVEQDTTRQILVERSNIERLRLTDLPRKVRAMVFVTGAVMVLVDGKFVKQERSDLAILASSLSIAPKSAVETIKQLRVRAKLEVHFAQAMRLCAPLADKQSEWQTSTRNIFHVLGVFLGVGIGAFAAPTILPGVFIGFFAGTFGGGFLVNVIADSESFDPNEYNFNDL